MKKIVIVMCMVVFLLSCCARQGERTPRESAELVKSAVVSVTILQEKGGRVSWLHGQDLVAFDRTGDDGYTDVYVMGVDGSDVACLTCDNPVLQLHNGNPSWYPSGEYIVFQAQDPDLTGLPETPMGTYVASPGVGINNNLWVMTAEGSKFWQLTDVKDRHGVLHPHFSPDGSKLLWSEITSPRMDRIGHWVIKLADFVVENKEIHITNIQTFQPNNLQLYEMHGFSPDGTTVLFSGIEQGGYYYDIEIYLMDVNTTNTTQLTDNDEWDEHAHFTPDGQSIIWVSSEGIPQPKGDSLEDTIGNPPKLDYWIMRIDGSNKQRLSGFNHPDAPEYIDVAGGIGLGDFDVVNGTIVAKMRRGHAQELKVLIEFDLIDYFDRNSHIMTLKRIYLVKKLYYVF